MNSKALTICSEPGCSTLTKDGRCDEHSKDKERVSAYRRGYTRKWMKASKHFIFGKTCVMCAKDGRTTAAQCVDHIVPHRGDYALFWNWDNWQPLCNSCHSKKTAQGQ